jgi:hypothetical protein
VCEDSFHAIGTRRTTQHYHLECLVSYPLHRETIQTRVALFMGGRRAQDTDCLPCAFYDIMVRLTRFRQNSISSRRMVSSGLLRRVALVAISSLPQDL